MQALTNDFALVQHVTEPMHIKGNFFDLVSTLKSADDNVKITNHDYGTSDHYRVIFYIASSHVDHRLAQLRDYRAIKAINRADFCRDLLNTTMFRNPSEDTERYAIHIKEPLLKILDQHAPVKRSSYQSTLYQWQDERIVKLKRLTRFYEHQYNTQTNPLVSAFINYNVG